MTQKGYNPFKCNFEREREKAKGWSLETLKFMIKDAFEAMEAGTNAGKYRDQISVYRQELESRGIEPTETELFKGVDIK
jgi:hypothetical protein